jgi:hypothetical protein
VPGGLRGELLVDGADPSTTQRRLDPSLVFREAGNLADKESYEVRWTGSLVVPSAGRYRLEMFTDGTAELTIDGESVAKARQASEPRSSSANLTLQSGRHTIEVMYRYLRGPGTFELRWQPPGGSRTIIPPSALVPD